MSETLYEQRPLGDAVERHIGGGTPSRQVPSYWKGEIPWASVKDFPEQKGVIQDTEEHISSAGLHASASNLIPAQTPLVCTRMAVGRAALPVIPMAINQDVKALFPALGVYAEYLLKLIQYIQPLAEGRAVGSTVKGIRIQDYLNIPVPLAPQAAQPVIAQILDTLDTAIRETEALIDKLKAVKQGLLHDLLTRGIDAKGQLRPPQSEAPQLYKESPLGWIPREWDAQPLSKAIDLVSGQHIPTELCNSVNNGVPYFTGPSDFLGAGTVVTQYTICPQVMCDEGDILITVKGSGCGKVAVAGVRACISRQLMAIKVPAPSLQYWLAVFQSLQERFNRLATGGNIPGMSRAQILELVVATPMRIEETTEIGGRIQAINDRLASEECGLAKLRLEKSGLMDDLLTGRVRVTPLLESVQQAAARAGA